jgi:hypothetical protein
MKTVIITLVSLVVSTSAFALLTPSNGCVDNHCAVEALFNDKGQTVFVDRDSRSYSVNLAKTEGVIVSGPDYGPENPRPTYSA